MAISSNLLCCGNYYWTYIYKMAMKILPAKKIVVLEPTELEASGGLITVEEKKPEFGTIIAIGEGKKPVKMKKGDIVAYRKYGESKFFFGTKQRLFVAFEDILGVIKK